MDYYGAINERRMGLESKVPEKPGVLKLIEQSELLRVPILDTTVMGFPYILLQEIAIAIRVKELFLQLAAQEANQ